MYVIAAVDANEEFCVVLKTSLATHALNPCC